MTLALERGLVTPL